MDATRQSPTLFESSPSPPHTLSPELVANFAVSHSRSPSRSHSAASSHFEPTSRPSNAPASTPTPDETSLASQPAVEPAETVEPAELSSSVQANNMSTPTGAFSDSDSGSDSDSASLTDTPATASTPRSAIRDDHPIPEQTPQLHETDEDPGPPREPAALSPPPSQPLLGGTSIESVPPPPPPTEPQPHRDNIPEWVKHEEDTSEPTEEELKEMAAAGVDSNAADVAAMEKEVWAEVDDPELRPVKKLRLSWVFKGVRGTREKPNRARIITSPTVFLYGYYWTVKFFPRGNKSRSCLAAFIRCSKTPPASENHILEGTFTCFEGGADSDIGTAANPVFKANMVSVRGRVKKEVVVGADPIVKSRPRRDAHPQTDPVGGETTSTGGDAEKRADGEDWRVSAQLGMVIYNPAEPRTCHDASSQHQFSRHSDDWGWDHLVRNWDEIHRRKRGQRQALLRNDSIALDAYVRIYDDPTKALWWHPSDSERQWDSKSLTGYFSMGTGPLYYSPAVAGITALSLLAPFRAVVQGADAGEWRRDSAKRPRPLIAQMQLMLFQMRHMQKVESYVHLDRTINELTGTKESFDDVATFWEALRRGIELELEGDDDALKKITSIFGPRKHPSPFPALPVQGVKDTAAAAELAFRDAKYRGNLPDFLPLSLDRQYFDPDDREWKLRYDRLAFSETIDLGAFGDDADSRYTLYGFVVHDGPRNSGKFYSVLRPDGPKGKWLAFEDGNGNKVWSYTRKRLQDYEGLEGEELKTFKFWRQTAYMVMYVRTSCLSRYLPGQLEPYALPYWLKPQLTEPYHEKEEHFTPDPTRAEDPKVEVEIFWDQGVVDQTGPLDLYNMKNGPNARKFRQVLVMHPDTLLEDLQKKLVETLELDDASKVALWSINYHPTGGPSKTMMCPVRLDTEIGRLAGMGQMASLWLAVFGQDDSSATLAERLPRLPSIEVPVVPRRVLDSDPGESDEELDLPITAPGPDPLSGDAGVVPDLEAMTLPHDAGTDNLEGAASAEARSGPAFEEVNAVEASRPEAVPEERSSHQAVPTVSTVEIMDELLSATQSLSSPGEPSSATQGTSTAASDANERGQETSPEAQVPSEATANGDAPGVIRIVPGASGANEEQEAPARPVSGRTATIVFPEDLSPEDAMLISSMIAADIAAVRSPEDNADMLGLDNGDILDPGSRPDTPRPGMLPIYGFLQIFDVEAQTITTKRPFFADRTATVSSTVRELLEYEPSHDLQLWIVDGAMEPVAISVEASFMDQALNDGCEVIVSEVLPESRLEALQEEGKFSNATDLVRYNVMSRRQHPVLSRTSSEPIEICDFGKELYRGPLVRGQRHGPHCVVISADGCTYEGRLAAGLKSGAAGKMTYPNGDVYTGAWLHDERHGHGEFVEKRTGNRYVGGFQNDKRWGKGVTYWEMADEQADLCQICYFGEIDSVFVECGHVCSCYECAKQCEFCPMCRKSSRQVIKMYRA